MGEMGHLLGDVEADLLKDLPRRTAHLILVAVHLPLREPPALRLPPLDAQHLGTRLVDEHRASKKMHVICRENGSVTYGGNGSSERTITACGDLRAVLSEGLEDVLGLALVWLEELALPEHGLRETQQRVVREHVRPDLAVVVVVKPVGGLDLEEEALEGFLLLGGAVDDETQRQVVDHVLQVRRRANIARSSSHERCSERRGEVWTATKNWGRTY